MFRLVLVRLVFTSLAACGSTPSHSAPEAPPTAIQSTNEIAGRWDVVSFEGYKPAHMHGATPAAFANFGPDGVGLRIECNYSGVNGVVRDGRFMARPGLRVQTAMGCGTEREERDKRYFAFFEHSPTVERIAGGRLRMEAGNSVLELERPDKRRLAFMPDREALSGRWRMEMLTRYGHQGGESGIGLSDIPGRIVIEGNRLRYDRCSQYGLDFDYSPDGRLIKTGGTLLPEKPNCPALKLPWQMTGGPSPDQILPLLHGNPWVESLGDGQLLIANEQLGLVLQKEQ